MACFFRDHSRLGPQTYRSVVVPVPHGLSKNDWVLRINGARSFTGRMPCLSPNEQCQSNNTIINNKNNSIINFGNIRLSTHLSTNSEAKQVILICVTVSSIIRYYMVLNFADHK